MQRYFNWFRDKEGRGFPGAVVTVYVTGTTTLADLYSPSGDLTSPAPIANPLSTDANGFFGFAVLNGTYDIQMSGGSVPTVIMPNITIGTTTLNGIAATDVNFTPAGTVTSVNVQDAIEEVAGMIAPVTETEIDFGTQPVPSKSFTIADSNIKSTSVIDVLASAKTATGRVGTDDMEWDGLSLSAVPATGSMIVYAVANPGPVVGKRKIHYRVG